MYACAWETVYEGGVRKIWMWWRQGKTAEALRETLEDTLQQGQKVIGTGSGHRKAGNESVGDGWTVVTGKRPGG